jgi:hypothetical protein
MLSRISSSDIDDVIVVLYHYSQTADETGRCRYCTSCEKRVSRAYIVEDRSNVTLVLTLKGLL